MDELERIKRDVDLRRYAERRGLKINEKGFAHCPKHAPDNTPSLQFFQHEGVWLFRDHHDGGSGSIVDFLMFMDGLSAKDAIKRLLDEFGQTKTAEPEIERVHIYRDESGKEIWQKIKLKDGTFRCRRREGDKWIWNIKGIKPTLYREDKIKDEQAAFVTEGEQDGDTLAALGYASTCAPFGKGSWPDELTPKLKGKEIRIIYDVGNDSAARDVARKLSAVCDHVYILRVPLEENEADITDYVSQFSDPEEKRVKFLEIVARGMKYTSTERKPFIGTLGNFFKAEIPETEVLIENFLRRQEFAAFGGVKGTHKTTLTMDLGLHFAAGISPWLNFPIPKPGRFLMIQQELGEAEFKKRLEAAVRALGVAPENFFPFTGTGDPIRLLEDKSFSRLLDLAEKFQPDIIALDPLHTFHAESKNESKTFARVRDRMNFLKVNFNAAVILTHHFSSKRIPTDPLAPTELGGWFRGSTILPDAADVLLALHRLPGQRHNLNLRRSFEDYNQVEITLRNGKWPPRFAVEFDPDSFSIRLSDVWHEIGKRIALGEIRELVEANGGEMLNRDLKIFFQTRFPGISMSTIIEAIHAEERAGYITVESMPGPGKPKLIKSKRSEK